jgi:uncharacterized protein YutE (UPF0331/DUF86 family)
MVRKEVLHKRLNKLDEHLEILHRLQRYDFEAFANDPEHYGSAERFLHLPIEALTDLGNHIIADLALGTVNSYRDIPEILAEQGYIEPELAARWIKMIGFRNVLVHEYLKIDRRIVYDILQTRLGDFEALRQDFSQFL